MNAPMTCRLGLALLAEKSPAHEFLADPHEDVYLP
jgi:hypothetical protein